MAVTGPGDLTRMTIAFVGANLAVWAGTAGRSFGFDEAAEITLDLGRPPHRAQPALGCGLGGDLTASCIRSDHRFE